MLEGSDNPPRFDIAIGFFIRYGGDNTILLTDEITSVFFIVNPYFFEEVTATG